MKEDLKVEITLTSSSLGEITCSSIEDAEIATASCLSSVTVLWKEQSEKIQFVFDPTRKGFMEALQDTKAIIQNKREDKPAPPKQTTLFN